MKTLTFEFPGAGNAREFVEHVGSPTIAALSSGGPSTATTFKVQAECEDESAELQARELAEMFDGKEIA